MASGVSRVVTRGGRMYRIPTLPGGGFTPLFPSVTSVLGLTNNSKFLLSWSVKTALDAVRSAARSPAGVNEGNLEEVLQKAQDAPDAVRDKAANFGTRAHAAIDSEIRGGAMSPVSVPPSLPTAVHDTNTTFPSSSSPPLPPAATAAAAEIEVVLNNFRRWHANSGLRLCSAGDTVVYSRRYGYAGALDCLGVSTDGRHLYVIDFKTSNSIHASYALQLAAYCAAVQEMLQSGELKMQEILNKCTYGGGGAGVVEEGADRSTPAKPLLPNAMEGKQDTIGTQQEKGIEEKTESIAAPPPLLPASISGLVVRLSKTEGGTAEVMQVQDVPLAFDAFKAALLLWHALNQQRKPLLVKAANVQPSQLL